MPLVSIDFNFFPFQAFIFALPHACLYIWSNMDYLECIDSVWPYHTFESQIQTDSEIKCYFVQSDFSRYWHHYDNQRKNPLIIIMCKKGVCFNLKDPLSLENIQSFWLVIGAWFFLENRTKIGNAKQCVLSCCALSAFIYVVVFFFKPGFLTYPRFTHEV